MSERKLDIMYHKIELREAKVLAEYYADKVNKYTKALISIQESIDYHEEQIKQLEEQS